VIEVSAEHLGDVQFEVRARGHRLVCDQPVSNGGYDEGITPPEFLLASLASCAGYYAAEYLKAHGIAQSGTRVRVTAEKAKAPPRLDNFRIEVDVPAELSPVDQQGVERAVHKCLIHNTLLATPRIELAIRTAQPVGV
jgi:putative redox protein